ncbi:MAG: protein translocase subunit SecD [Vampirovibrio sp.]|nr:protein translocase subunit SecD [Vampirovibrio sp.]
MLNNPRVIFLFILILVGAAIGILWKMDFNLGLDLKGGTRLTLEAVPTADVKEVTPQVMESLRYIVDRRVNGMGIGEAIVQQAGDKRIIVEIPGVKDPDAAKKILGKVGNLEFRMLDENGLWVSSGVSGKDLTKAEIGPTQTGDYVIHFELNAAGGKRFGDLTQKLVQEPNEARRHLGIFFDGEMQSAPIVRSAIQNGAGIIEGYDTREEAKEIVDVLNAGALPVDVEFVEENTVGPLLGQAAIQQSLFAGALGLVLVIVFMLLYYRTQGFVADLALVVYTLLTLALYNLIGVTFTLAGIAGFILSIGMAVDANILIFERTREELQKGRSSQKSIDVGFERAFPSILDSNVTTLITCLLLWVLGTGAVKGFALTLAIGVGVSMFSAITVTKTFLHVMSSTGTPSRSPAKAPARAGS